MTPSNALESLMTLLRDDLDYDGLLNEFLRDHLGQPINFLRDLELHPTQETFAPALELFITVHTDRDCLTDLCIWFSICPLHFHDWAICFDDDLDDCAQIRTIMPSRHDT